MSVSIAHDLTCVACGYNLRGLHTLGRCPECGSPIARSLGPRGVAGARPGWRLSVRLGASLLGVCLLYWSLLNALPMLPESPVADLFLGAASGVLALAIAAVLLAACALLTRPDTPESKLRPPPLMRWALLALATVHLLTAGALGWMTYRHYPEPWFPGLAVGTSLEALVVALCFLVLAGVARRIPRPVLAFACTMVGLGIAAGMVLNLPVWLATLWTRGAGPWAWLAIPDALGLLRLASWTEMSFEWVGLVVLGRWIWAIGHRG